MYPFLNIGPFAIPSKPFLIILGIYISLWFIEKSADQLNIKPEWLSTTGINSIIVGVIGARLVFAFTHWEATFANPLSVVWPITVGYSLWGAILAGLLTFLYLGWQAKLSIPKLLDALTPSLLILICAWVLGDFMGGPGYGTSAALPLFNQHPVQLYECAAALITFGAWWLGRPQRRFDGWLFLVSTALFSASILITLNFRGGSVTIFNGWQLNQLIAFITMILALGGLAIQSPNASKESLTSS